MGKMIEQILPMLTVVVAVLMALLASSVSLDHLHGIVLIMRFFETMIPVLVVGALLKFLFSMNCR